MESEMSERETSSNFSTVGQLDEHVPGDDFSQSPISKLPVECLTSIFSLLPIADRVKIQRVCKHWRAVSLKSWSSCKTLGFEEKDWGYKYWLRDAASRRIDLDVLKSVLKLCRPHVTRIDFSKYHRYDPESDMLIPLKANKSFFVLIKHACPKLTALDIRRLEITPQGLEYLGKRFANLTEFAIYKCYSESTSYGEHLSLLFRNNQNLRRVILHGQVYANCLLDLNPIAIDEFQITYGWGGEEIICSVLKRFINLRSIGIRYENHRWSGIESSVHVNEVLKAIEPHSQNLKELGINSPFSTVEIYSKNFQCFKNLQKLLLKGQGLKIDLITIAEYCTKLTCVKLIDYLVTDVQMASIIQLPELRELHLCSLDRVTDAIFVNHVSSLNILKCIRCPRLTNFGLRELLRNSYKSLQRLEITECEEVDLQKLTLDAKKAIDGRSTSSFLKLLVK